MAKEKNTEQITARNMASVEFMYVSADLLELSKRLMKLEQYEEAEQLRKMAKSAADMSCEVLVPRLADEFEDGFRDVAC